MVDDEWYNLEEISDLVEKTGFMSVNGRYQNGVDALKEAPRVMPQAAFIDIEMPEMDGLTLAEKLLEQDSEIKIVFITGWNQYAVAAFDLNALDYIMKPVNRDRFNRMAERLKREVALGQPARTDKPTLTIRCFGRFETVLNGRPVVWKRTKAEELFAFFLLSHDTFVHKEEILENLWQGYEYQKSLTILQTSVCKIRNVLSPCGDKAKLVYADNRYGLFLEDVACDYFEVERALRDFDKDRPETYEPIKGACNIFLQGLFPHYGYLWSEAIGESIRCRLVNFLKKAAQGCLPESDYRIDVIGLIARLSPMEENEQKVYLNALKTRGRMDEFIRHCEWLRQTLLEVDETELSQEISKLLEAYQTKSRG